MKKILVIHKNTIELEPPTQMAIQHMNDLGLSVRLITLGVNDYWKKELEKRGIEYNDLGLASFASLKKRSVTEKLKAWFKYRKEVLKELALPENSDSIIWFVNADSLAPLLFSKIHKKISYIMHILEMYDHSSFYRYVLKKYIKNAQRLIVCEDSRAAIFNVWFRPEKYPVVLPNKPYKLPEKNKSEDFLEQHHPELYQSLKHAGKIILYQGGISEDRDLSPVLEAANGLTDFTPVLMGKDFGMLGRYKKICPKLIHIPFIPSPQHLYVTSMARIGILMYDPISLNQIFCAPNKIFEYSGYGVPMIGNNIPGLYTPFQKFNCGKVFNPEQNTLEIAQILLSIDENFDSYSKNSYSLFNTVDNKSIIKSVFGEI